MRKGFVVFCTKNWLPIINNLINSILIFSVYEIEVNCINFNHDFKNNRIISRTLNIKNCNFFNITKCKIMATLESKFDIGLLVDGDMIVTDKIDDIFEDNLERITKLKFPLFTKHPHNPHEKHKRITNRVSKKEPKMKWVYSVYLFTQNQKWFFQEILDIMNKISNKKEELYYMPVPEEGIINALLSEYEIDYDMGYNYCPNGYPHVIDYYLDGKNEDGRKHIEDCYLSYDCPVKFYAFHGHNVKNVSYIKGVIERMKKVKL